MKRFLTSVIAMAAAVSLIIPIAMKPQEAGAFSFSDVLDTASIVASCYLSNALSGSSLVNELINQDSDSELGDKVSSFGERDPESYVPTDVVINRPLEDEVKRDTSTNCYKRELLKKFSESILKKIVGEVGFIENFEDLLLNAASGANDEFVTQLESSSLCPQNRAVILTLLGGDPGLEAPAENPLGDVVTCTLGNVLDLENGGLEDYYDDFRNGGWDAWLEQIQPQNTLLGSFLIAKETRDAQIANRVAGQQLEAQTTEGFNPEKTKTCEVEKTIPLVDGTEKKVCVKYKEIIVTPGALLEKQVDRALSNEFENQTGADTHYEIVKNFLDFLLSKLLGNDRDSGGVLGLSRFKTGIPADIGTATTTTPANPTQPPLGAPTITQPTGGVRAGVPATFTVTATGTPGEQLFLLVTWDNTGQFEIFETTVAANGVATFSPPHTWSAAGTYIVRMSTTDSLDGTGSPQSQITVNVLPQ